MPRGGRVRTGDVEHALEVVGAAAGGDVVAEDGLRALVVAGRHELDVGRSELQRGGADTSSR